MTIVGVEINVGQNFQRCPWIKDSMLLNVCKNGGKCYGNNDVKFLASE
jgi:hypothetical protein